MDNSTFDIILIIAILFIIGRVVINPKSKKETKEEIMNDPNFPEKWKKLLPEEKDDAESIVNAFKEGYKEGKNKGTDS